MTQARAETILNNLPAGPVELIETKNMKTLLLAIATLSSLFIAAPQADARDRNDRRHSDRGRHYSHRGHHHHYRSSPRVYYSSPRYYYPTRRAYYYDDYSYPRRYYRPNRSGLSLFFRF
jgi:hypothetical protein